MDPLRDLPLGFGLLLLQNPQASLAFQALSTERRMELLRHTRALSSQEEMRGLVDSLAAGDGGAPQNHVR